MRTLLPLPLIALLAVAPALAEEEKSAEPAAPTIEAVVPSAELAEPQSEATEQTSSAAETKEAPAEESAPQETVSESQE